MKELEVKIENWKKSLLDLGKRNRLLSYKVTKRSNIRIIEPSIEILFNKLVVDEKQIKFPHPINEQYIDGEEVFEDYSQGDVKTDRSIAEQQKTLRALRSKARTAAQEQGINVLYLAFGFLEWKEDFKSNFWIKSPLILVPVKLKINAVTDPYVLCVNEDEIIINPTLTYKLENDFAIKLPNFQDFDEDIRGYLDRVDSTIAKKNGWRVLHQTDLSILSFMKINMYADLENNSERLNLHPILRALAGDRSEIERLPEELDNYDHDSKTRPIDTFQVVDADSSQQDAVLYSKNNASFILQGPPGTGKSQTITNIIAEALADGKKVLFVSEKMAALEVVYNRLSSVGLGDFCLPLHSHKANKKDVINNLSKTLNTNRNVRLKSEVMFELDSLLEQRNKLNQYNEDLHKKNQPWDKSIYEINGLLAKLPQTQDIIFNIKDVENIDNIRVTEYNRKLSEFAKTIGMMKKDYTSNPWIDCNVNVVTNELRHDITVNLQKLIPAVQKLQRTLCEQYSRLYISDKSTINNAQHVINFLEISAQIPRKVPKEWIISADTNSLLLQSKKYIKIQKEYKELKESIEQNYLSDIFDVDPLLLKVKYVFHTDALLKGISNNHYLDVDMIVDKIGQLCVFLTEYKENLQSAIEANQSLTSSYPFEKANNLVEFKELNDLLDQLQNKIDPTPMWFEESKRSILNKIISDTKENYEIIKKEKRELLEEFDNDIMNIEHKKILVRFRTEYTNFLKIFKKSYKADKKLFISLYSNSEIKINDSIILKALEKLNNVSIAEKWISDSQMLINQYLGNHYANEYTDWNELSLSIKKFDVLKEKLSDKIYDCRIKNLLIEGKGYSEIESVKSKIKTLLEESSVKISYVIDDSEKILLTYLQEKINKSLLICEKFSDFYSELSEHIKNKVCWSQIKEHLEILASINRIEKEIALCEGQLKYEYQFMYNRFNTKWEDIVESLEWVDKFKQSIKTIKIDEIYIERLCNNAANQPEIIEGKNEIVKAIDSLGDEWKWFLNMFDGSDKFYNEEMNDLVQRLSNCANGLIYIEEWTDYRRHRKECYDSGLAEYIEKAELAGILKTQLVPAFFKRLYRLWLDIYIQKYPYISNFRRKTQEERIEQFKQLDKSQLKIAQARLKELLIRQLPDINVSTSAIDEVGILKREASKKRKVMPLRRLFASIPNLLPALKPCLMMSPLSVSLFLQTNGYDFDIVIFDEASQVKTEDAVGAIMRGKQVIICGDNKQLPPTNFFGVTLSDDDFDTEEDVEENVFESILDETLTILPERTLKWHYRSRHEHLIAFSNAKIYKHSLITFPSSYENVKHNGVEYIYVENGVYDRGKTRTNINEAKRIAELVLEHINENPSRSLGIVTFSTQQQQAVENQIRQLRIKNQQFESFFNEEKEEAFFIKNLENVQGDERDTIMFSIGYAKDGTGKPMAMNFGPLSRVGGERRLNVAITRAKHNVKLVGSIRPTDIDLNRTQSEGVHLLREYIDFAINGVKTLEYERVDNDIFETDSPFEDSVYEFLVSKGYRVATQVGCSGYKIDLAVKHPTLNGRFVLGVECDGATYHSARTARERDRIRQTVLEDIGWKIYRIWSTDWIKDPIAEGKKLIERVEKSIEEYSEKLDSNKHINAQGHNNDELIDIVKIENELDEANMNNPYDFAIYQIANPYDVSRIYPDSEYVKKVIEHIVKIESPIHQELLYKRIACIFGREKATSVVRQSTAHYMKYCLDKIITKNDFCWWKTNDEIKVRKPDDELSIRAIEYIAVEEIGQAMYVIASNGFGITKDGLFHVASRELGFKRIGQKITLAMNQALNYLIELKKVVVIDEKIIAK